MFPARTKRTVFVCGAYIVRYASFSFRFKEQFGMTGDQSPIANF